MAVFPPGCYETLQIDAGGTSGRGGPGGRSTSTPPGACAMEPTAIPELPPPMSGLPFTRVRVPLRGWLFHAGQPNPGVYFVRAGFLKTTVGSADGRERITAFPMRGDWLGLESLGNA